MSVNERTNILNVVFHPSISLFLSFSRFTVPEAMKERARRTLSRIRFFYRRNFAQLDLVFQIDRKSSKWTLKFQQQRPFRVIGPRRDQIANLTSCNDEGRREKEKKKKKKLSLAPAQRNKLRRNRVTRNDKYRSFREFAVFLRDQRHLFSLFLLLDWTSCFLAKCI